MECLVDLGWSGTSTTEVARRAGVSRAQQHHYPTKMVLVAASLEHLLEAQRLAYETAFAVLPAERRNVSGALDLLWEVFRGRPAKALMELAVAARTDDELRPLCIDLNERILQVILETFERLFPKNTLPPISSRRCCARCSRCSSGCPYRTRWTTTRRATRPPCCARSRTSRS